MSSCTTGSYSASVAVHDKRQVGMSCECSIAHPYTHLVLAAELCTLPEDALHLAVVLHVPVDAGHSHEPCIRTAISAQQVQGVHCGIPSNTYSNCAVTAHNYYSFYVIVSLWLQASQ